MDTTDTAVIHVRCNDISPRQNKEKLTEDEIAKEIISVGSYCRDKDVNETIISGLLLRKGQNRNSRVSKVNYYLQIFGLKIDFISTIITKIKRDNLFSDGLHLLGSDKVILANNFFIISILSVVYILIGLY